MDNIKSFRSFIGNSLNESEVESIKSSAGITDDEWNAMMANPEISKEATKYSEYLKGEKAKTLIEKAIDVVADVFGDGNNVKTFMKRLAAVESCYGTNPNTYRRPGITKGVFQLDKNTALRSIGYQGQKPQGNHVIRKLLEDGKNKIKTDLGLNWDMTPYESLSKPLYNALACRLFLEIKMRDYKYNRKTNKVTVVNKSIPSDLNGQAKWWKDRYNTSAGAGTEAKFKNPTGCNL